MHGNRYALITHKDFHGLKTSDSRCCQRLEDFLLNLKFAPYTMDPDIWMRHCGDHCERVAVCADDLLIGSKSLSIITDILSKDHAFKLKVTRHVSHELDRGFGRDGDGALHFAPRKNIEK